MSKSNRVALYARVCTDGQTTENQRRELRAAVERHGWTRGASALAAQGMGRVKIAKTLGVGVSLAQRVLASATSHAYVAY